MEKKVPRPTHPVFQHASLHLELVLGRPGVHDRRRVVGREVGQLGQDRDWRLDGAEGTPGSQADLELAQQVGTLRQLGGGGRSRGDGVGLVTLKSAGQGNLDGGTLQRRERENERKSRRHKINIHKNKQLSNS